MKWLMFLAVNIVIASACSLPNCFNIENTPRVKGTLPQFVLISHDDAITNLTKSYIDQLNLTGIPMTFFTTWQDTLCDNVRYYYNRGDEIALHTMTHPHLTKLTKDKMKYELLTVRDNLNQTCGIPIDKMVGARSPFLEANSQVYDILYADKHIEWDSSFSDYNDDDDDDAEDTKTDKYHNYEKGTRTKLWPYTLDHGRIEKIVKNKRWPGFWEVPLNSYISIYKSIPSMSMDPARVEWSDEPSSFAPAEDMFEMLMFDFHYAYTGKKTPFTIALHTPWFFGKDYAETLNVFLDYVNGLDDVYFVTYSQLVEWMKNPIAVEDMPKKNY